MIAKKENEFQVGVSVIIVTWNHRDFLPHCIESLSNQTYPSIEVLVIDNASIDGSVEWLHDHAPFVRLIQLDQNTGFAHAFNLGVNETAGEFIISLNPDVTIAQDFIENLITAVGQDPQIGMVAPKLLRADDKQRLDSTGLFLNRQRRPYDRGQMQVDYGQFDQSTEVFGACGAAALYRRSMLEQTAIDQEYFDEDFFAYYEDADLAWRARLYGWRCVFAAKAVAKHVRGWGDTLRKRPDLPHRSEGPRMALRNHYLMIMKNDSLKGFLEDCPSIILTEVPRLFYMALFRQRALIGMIDYIRLLPRTKKKRNIIQKNRKVSNWAIRQWFNQQ